MDANDPATPAWKKWNTCYILSRNHERLGDDTATEIKGVRLDHDVDWEGIRRLGEEREVSSALIVKVAWALTLQSYINDPDICFGLLQHTTADAVHQQLNPTHCLLEAAAGFEELMLLGTSEPTDGTSPWPFDTVLSLHLGDCRPQHPVAANGVTHGSNRLLGSAANSFPLATAPDRLATDRPLVTVAVSDATISIKYPSPLWSDERAIQVAEVLSMCIRQLTERPKSAFEDLDLIPPSHFETVVRWNNKDFGRYDSRIPDMISEQAEAMPEAVAINAWDGKLTRSQLDVLASRLAQALITAGLAGNETVAFLFHKSKWNVVAILAILKAGAAATALDPTQPVSRMHTILQTTKTRWILVGQDLQASLSAPELTEFVVDERLETEGYLQTPPAFVAPELRPDDLAFIQFTSGSTGNPKAVKIEHRTYIANAVSQQLATGMTNTSSVLQIASHSFDAILVEVLTTLMAGACICVPSEHDRLNRIAGCIHELGVDWFGTTPSLAKTLDPALVPNLKTFVLWGEPATQELINTWVDRLRLINVYGPSENSVIATSHDFSSSIAHYRRPSHIGRAIRASNTWVVRTGSRHRLAPIGAIGELVLQGATPAQGYLRDPGQSTSMFQSGAPWLPPCYTDELHQRLYFTGDLVHYNDDGTLEIIGRCDSEVKIRGHRVDLADIEHQVRHAFTLPRDAVVELLKPASRPGRQTLAAFTVKMDALRQDSGSSLIMSPTQATRAEAMFLHRHLTAILPSVSVPSVYIPVTHIPVSATGKADRKMLRHIGSSLSEDDLLAYSGLQTTGRRPTTQGEILAAKLWADCLGIDAHRLSLDDSFLRVGGDSILAMRLVNKARMHGSYITVAQILQNDGLDHFASMLNAQTNFSEDEVPTYEVFSSLPSHHKTFVRDIASPQLGASEADFEDISLATAYQIENLAWTSLKRRGGTNYITFDFSDSDVDAAIVQSACQQLVAHHAILRTVYFTHHRQVYQATMKELPYEIVHHCGVRDFVQTTSAIVEQDLTNELDIHQALIKFWLLQSNNKLQRIVFRASHCQYDGITLSRWCRELAMACEGKDLNPTASYHEYMYYARSRDAQAAKLYWTATLAGSAMTEVYTRSGLTWNRRLDARIESTIDSTVTRSNDGITAATILKAAWALVLAEMAGTNDVVFGSVVGGRNTRYSRVEQVAGACIDNIPVRVVIDPGMTRQELLLNVQRQYFEAVEFEMFQHRRIIQDCTDWKPWQRFSTLVEYVNLVEDLTSVNVNGKALVIDEIRPPADRHDITIWAAPSGKQTYINLWYCSDLLSEDFAQKVANRLQLHLHAFKADVLAPIVLEPQEELSIPLTPSDAGAGSANIITRERTDSGVELSDSTEGELRTVVAQIWLNVLGCNATHLDIFWAAHTPFYAVWPELIAAVAMAQKYTSLGFTMSIEEVLENSSMRAQLKRLHHRQRDGAHSHAVLPKE